MSDKTRMDAGATPARKEKAGQAKLPRELADKELKKVSGGHHDNVHGWRDDVHNWREGEWGGWSS